jgi:terminal uridylyltransferase
MDLCCLIDSEERLAASDLVTMLGDLLERGMYRTPALTYTPFLTFISHPETKFHVKPLPHARIPIVKLSLDPSPGLPLGIACDIGFENRLALENTRLLMCYAMVDPSRVRTMVLFRKSSFQAHMSKYPLMSLSPLCSQSLE